MNKLLVSPGSIFLRPKCFRSSPEKSISFKCLARKSTSERDVNPGVFLSGFSSRLIFPANQEQKKKLHLTSIRTLETRGKSYRVTTQMINGGKRPGKIVKVTVVPNLSNVCKIRDTRITSARKDESRAKTEIANPAGSDYLLFTTRDINAQNSSGAKSISVWPKSLFSKRQNDENAAPSNAFPIGLNDDLSIIHEMMKEISAKVMKDTQFARISLMKNDSVLSNRLCVLIGGKPHETQFQNKVKFEIRDKGRIKVMSLKDHDYLIPLKNFGLTSGMVETKNAMKLLAPVVRNEVPAKPISMNSVTSGGKTMSTTESKRTCSATTSSNNSEPRQEEYLNATMNPFIISKLKKNWSSNFSELSSQHKKQPEEKCLPSRATASKKKKKKVIKVHSIPSVKQEALVSADDPIAKYINMLKRGRECKTAFFPESTRLFVPPEPAEEKKPTVDTTNNELTKNMIAEETKKLPMEIAPDSLVKLDGKDGIVKVPITRDNFPTKVDPVVEPHRNVVDVITSIDRSTVIIQKDFYIAEKIIKKIRDDKNPKPKPPSSADGKVNASPQVGESKEHSFSEVQSRHLEGTDVGIRLPRFRRVDYLNIGSRLASTDGAVAKHPSRFNELSDLYLNRRDGPAILLGEDEATTKLINQSPLCGTFSIVLRKDESKSDHPLVLDKLNISIVNNPCFKELDKPQSTSFAKLVDSAISNLGPRSKIQFSPFRQSNLPHSTQPKGGVDVTARTIITSVKEGTNTNIEVQETQNFVDKRLPVPFRTESVFQMFGRTDSLKEHIRIIEQTKAQLVTVSPDTTSNPPQTPALLPSNAPDSKPTGNHNGGGNNLSPVTVDIVESKTDDQSVQTKGESKIIPIKKEVRMMNKTRKKSRDGHSTDKSVIVPNKTKKMSENGTEISRYVNVVKAHPQVTKSNSFHDNFNEIKVINDKNFDTCIKQILTKPPDQEPNVNVRASKEGSYTGNITSVPKTGPKTGAKNQVTLYNSRNPNRKSKFVIKNKFKTPIHHKKDDQKKKIVELKPVIKTDPKEKSSIDTTRVNLTKSSNRKLTKIKVIETQPGSVVKQDKDYNQVTESKLKDYKKPTESANVSAKTLQPTDKSVDKDKPKDDKSVSQIRGTPTDQNPSSKLSVDLSNTKPIFQEDRGDNIRAIHNPQVRQKPSESEPSKKKLEVIPRKSEHLKALFSYGPRESPAFSSTTIDKLAQKEKFDDPKNENLKAQSKTVTKPKKDASANNKSHIKEGVPLVLNRDKIRALKADIKTKRSSLKKTADPDLEIGLDKAAKEIIPPFDKSKYKKCAVPFEEITSFPMLNKDKQLGLSPPTKEGVTSISFAGSPKLNDTLQSLPSVSRILNATMPNTSKAALNRWRFNIISHLGEKGFEEFYTGRLTRGSEFHRCLQNLLSGKKTPENIEPCTKQCLKSVEWVQKHLTDIRVVESQVVHSQLGYRGVLDCVAKFRGKPVVIEWKRSDAPKPLIQSTYDAPVQLSAYLGALNFDPNYEFQVDGGILVIAYSNGARADVFEMTQEKCGQYWKIWLTRLQQYLIESSLRDIK